MWSNLYYGIGQFFEWSFTGIEKLASIPNIILFFAGLLATIIWISRMLQYNKEAEERGTLK